MDALGINLPGQLGLLLGAAYLARVGGGSVIVARRKGLNAYLGFILGAVLGIIGLVIVLIIPDSNVEGS